MLMSKSPTGTQKVLDSVSPYNRGGVGGKTGWRNVEGEEEEEKEGRSKRETCFTCCFCRGPQVQSQHTHGGS